MSEDTKILKQIAASLARIEARLGVEVPRKYTEAELGEWKMLGREFTRIMTPVLQTSSGPPSGGGTMSAEEFFAGRDDE